MLSDVISKRLYQCNYICTLLIVILHSTYTTITNSKIVRFELAVGRFITVICAVSVGMFFAMSSYLFFYEVKSIKQIGKKVVKRIHTILLPYITWGLVTFIYYTFIVRFTHLFDEKTVPTELLEMVKYIWNCSGDPPLWYLRTLFVFFLISPLLWLVLRRIHLYVDVVLIAASILLNILFPQKYTNICFWLPQILIGSVLAIQSDKIKKIMEYLSNKMLLTIRTLTIILGGLLSIATYINNNEFSVCYYCWRVFSPIALYAVISLCDKGKYRKHEHLFWIFCTHFIVIEAIRGVLLKLIGTNAVTLPIIYIITVLITICCCNITGSMLHKLLPRMYNLLTGNR